MESVEMFLTILVNMSNFFKHKIWDFPFIYLLFI